jgi:RimJ/RimL family protein N-acetyltransferase
MNWINHSLTLEGNRVLLVPLEREHFPGLVEAGNNKDIWSFYHFDGTNSDTLISQHEEAIAFREKGEQYPFAVIDRLTGKVIGCTRYLNLSEEHRGLEIGSTWYNPKYWSTGYNEECKLALLTHCFETLKTVRVLIAAWDKNMRSRKAIERIGARFEGILRNNRIRNGEARSTAYYSIVPEEWPEVRTTLLQLIAERSKPM